MTAKQNPGSMFQDDQPLPAFRRLVILVPNADLDEIRLARRIRAMMSPYKVGILLLSPVIREEEDSLEHRRLTNLAAILGDPFYTVTTKTISGKRWIGEIKQNLLPGDLLVCLKGQHAPSLGQKSQPIDQALVGQLPCPVYVLNNIAIKETSRRTFSHRLVGWLVPIAIILLFLGFDVRIILDTGGWVNTMLLGTTLIVEVVLIWSWNNLWD